MYSLTIGALYRTVEPNGPINAAPPPTCTTNTRASLAMSKNQSYSREPPSSFPPSSALSSSQLRLGCVRPSSWMPSTVSFGAGRTTLRKMTLGWCFGNRMFLSLVSVARAERVVACNDHSYYFLPHRYSQLKSDLVLRFRASEVICGFPRPGPYSRD